MLHKVCNPNHCLKGIYGKPLTKCKYGFPYSTPQPCRELDEDHIRYLDMRRLTKDAVVVQYNPEIAILWGAHHNVQYVSKHGFEQYLSKYTKVKLNLVVKLICQKIALNHKGIFEHV